MPELPDITIYCDALKQRISSHKLGEVRLFSPFFLRSVEPAIELAHGRTVTGVERIGKRIVLVLEGDYFLVVHLMIAGRFKWQEKALTASRAPRNYLAEFRFDSGSLLVTEAGTKKRASLYFVAGRSQLKEHDPGGIDVLHASNDAFRKAITARNRTLKRALTDPHILSGIGNAYSDEILHAARLSPVLLTQRLSAEQITRLFDATRTTLKHWLGVLRAETGDGFPTKVTAFRAQMAVHGRYREPCPVCATPIQRIRYVSNETNYCPRCQTGGKLLADRALSRLLKKRLAKDYRRVGVASAGAAIA